MPEEEIKVNLKSTKESFNKVLKFFKQKKVITILALALLLIIVIVGLLMRLQNLSLLIDHTTGQYVPQLELDSFYWLREASTIVQMGHLPAVDTLRAGAGNVTFSPEILPYFFADAYKILHALNSSITLNFVDVIYPPIVFALGLIVFFFLIKVLTKSNVASVIGSLFLIVIPTYLYRSISGFSDHDALGTLVFFSVLVVYTLSLMWLNKKDEERKIKSKRFLIGSLLGAAVGFLTGLNIVSWGGLSEFIPIILPLSFLIFWLIKIKDLDSEKKELSKYLVFYIMFVLFSVFSATIFNYPIGSALERVIINPTSFLLSFTLLFCILDFLIIKFEHKIPKGIKKHHVIWSILIAGIIGLAFIALRENLFTFISNIINQILHPFGTDRLNVTVAENQQTYTTDWLSQTDPTFFWLFFAGLITLGINMSKGIKEKKRKIGFVILWIFMISGILLSRFSSSSILNGTNFISKLFLFGSIALFVIYCIRLYFKEHIEISPNLLVLFCAAVVMIIVSDTAAYIMSIVSPYACILVGYLIFNLGSYFKRSKDDLLRMLIGLLLIGAIIAATFSFINLYNNSSYQAKNTGIGNYGAQWDSAMAWIRTNTPLNSIFVHWWDYGYIVEYLGQRATLSDGGHFEGTFRDYLIGRYVLTEPNPNLALSFMKSNNVSYLLIDSTDLGKYSAYSLIGGDTTGTDRYSSVPIMVSDPSQIQVVNNTTTRVYQNVVPTDQDIVYNTTQGQQIFLPQGQAYVIGVILQSNQTNSTSAVSFSQPHEVVYYNNQQIQIPLRYLYLNNRLVDFGGGFPGGVEVLPSLGQNSAGTTQVDSFGALIYMSPKVFNSLFAQLYLMNDPLNEYPTIHLALTQDDPVIQMLKAQGFTGDFLYYNGFDGPIKIWKTDYPSNILSKQEFTQTSGVYGAFDNLTVTA
jgi:asparagine N-glycosylation enzyme membrane subunit Stt3